MAGSLVLIIGEEGDWSADTVAAAVAQAGGAPFRLTTHDFPQRMILQAASHGEGWSGSIATTAGVLALERVSGVYYRRPRTFDLPAAMSQPERRFARAQARIGLGGVLASLDATWVNSPSALADCEYKPRQLAAAGAAGLRTPATLITNDPQAVRDFAAEVGELVVKPLAEPSVAEDGALSVAYCRRLAAADYRDLAGVEATAHLFQQWVEPQYAVRLTAVGADLFPVAIHPNSQAARIDWRSDYDNVSYAVIDCPPSVCEGIQRFLSCFGLVFGALDFVVDQAGDWYLLECNAAGQWGWIAEETGLPIAEAIAATLIKGVRA